MFLDVSYELIDSIRIDIAEDTLTINKSRSGRVYFLITENLLEVLDIRKITSGYCIKLAYLKDVLILYISISLPEIF